MKRNTLNFVVDLISLVVMLGMVWTGLLIHYVLPPGHGRGHGMSLWGWDRHGYGDVHFYLALVLMGLMVVHIWLHWAWVCATISKTLGSESSGKFKRGIYGIIFLIIIGVLIAGSLYWVNGQVGSNTKQNSEHDNHEESSLISGRTTLIEAARIGGITVEELIKKLKLPSDIDQQEQLGRLRQRYNFDMHDVRNIVEKNLHTK